MSTSMNTLPAPIFSLAVCTRNRAPLLRRTLAALCEQVASQSLQSAVELLVVDNQSTDDTPQVVAEFPNVAYFCEPTLGIAHGRNRAAHEARGAWLIYVDDDAVPAPGWLAALQRCTLTQDSPQPSPACILGRVTLDWEGGTRAAWFPAAYETLLSAYDLGIVGHYVGEGGYLLTTNTAFERETLLRLGGFRTDLGHRGKSLLGGEDNDIFNRLIADGCPVWYEPHMLAAHWVSRARQTRRWLIERVFWDGATQPLLDYGTSSTRARYLREMGRDIRRVLRITLDQRRVLLSASGRFDLLLEWVRQFGRFWMNTQLFYGKRAL